MTFYLGAKPEAAMKPVTIFYYSSSTDGELAKKLALKERHEQRSGLSRDAPTFDGEKEKDVVHVIILSSVNEFHRKKIAAVYGDLVEDYDEDTAVEEGAEEKKDEEKKDDETGRRAVHRGGGKWYIMLGDEKVSGPHTKEEAEELVK